MNNSAKVHNLLKDAEVSPVSTLIEKLKSSTVFEDVLTDKDFELYPVAELYLLLLWPTSQSSPFVQ